VKRLQIVTLICLFHSTSEKLWFVGHFDPRSWVSNFLWDAVGICVCASINLFYESYFLNDIVIVSYPFYRNKWNCFSTFIIPSISIIFSLISSHWLNGLTLETYWSIFFVFPIFYILIIFSVYSILLWIKSTLCSIVTFLDYA